MTGAGLLRQGTVLSGCISDIISVSVDLRPVISENEKCILIVISQDCDIVRDFAAEPYIEFILGRVTPELDSGVRNGRNPRKLSLVYKENDNILISIHDRFRVRKDELDIPDFDAEKSAQSLLDIQALSILRKWVSKRYVRAAFPDEFNRRLSESKEYKKLAKSALSKDVMEVYVYVPDAELVSGQAYEPEILAVVPDDVFKDKTKKDGIERLYDSAFSCTGVEPDVHVVKEDLVSLKDMRSYKRWDYDSYSLNGEQSPVDGIDSL